MPNLTRVIPNESDLARFILNQCRVRIMASRRQLDRKADKWRAAEETALAYLPEREVDSVRRARRENGLPEYTTIQIPYSYAVLMAAHTYLTSVFLNRNPVWQFTGRHGESMQATQALEAIIDYQLQVGAMLPVLYTWLYDAGKYGIGIIGNYWDDRYERVTTLQEEPLVDMFGMPLANQSQKVLRTKTYKTYSGNRIYNIQPWDFLWDTRFPARDFQQGEYCALRFKLTWSEVKRREIQGYYMNVDKLVGSSTNFAPDGEQGSSRLDRPNEDFMDYGERVNGSSRPAMVKGYEVYVELIPTEWKLTPSSYPEKWVFTVTSDFKTLLGAQPLGALHCKYPVAVLPLEVEAYGLSTRGYPDILEPVQHTIDWLINSHFFNVRAALNNRVIVDPSRVVMKDVLNPLPGGVIRLKPDAYGTDTRLAWSQMTIADVTQTHLRDFAQMISVGERTVGINDQILGTFNGGSSRKTATEIRTSTSFGTNRLKTTAEWLSCVGFDPLSQMLVQNSQQFYDQSMKFKIAGDLTGSAGPSFIQVTPEDIAGYYSFVPVDGTLPIDRYAQANLWRELMAQMRNFPQLMMGYDLVGIFEWVAQLTGLKNITRYKIGIAPADQLAAAAQAGNVVPLSGAKAGGGTSGVGEPQPAQISGMGVSG